MLLSYLSALKVAYYMLTNTNDFFSFNLDYSFVYGTVFQNYSDYYFCRFLIF